MYLYEATNRFNPKTGEKLETPTYDVVGVLCDFTGKEVEYTSDLGVEFNLDYGGTDPCAGCAKYEFDFSKKWNISVHDFLFGAPFIFNQQDSEIIIEMIEEAKTDPEMEGRLFTDQIYRWARIRTAERLLSEGKYTPEQLGLKQ